MKLNLYRQGSAAVALLAGLMLLPAGSALAGEADRAPGINRQGRMAEAKVFQSGIDLAPKVGYTQAILTVSGASGVFRRTIEAGDPLEVDLFDPEGEVLLDGVYRWELRLMPDAKTAKELRAMARAGKSTADAWPPASGEFVVRGGVIDNADVSEPRPARVQDPNAGGRGLKAAAGSAGSENRVSEDGDEGVAAGRAEPRGLEAKAMSDGARSQDSPRSPESAAARAAAGDNDDNVAASGPVVEKAGAADGGESAEQTSPQRRHRKYATPDNQGRSKGPSKKRESGR